MSTPKLVVHTDVFLEHLCGVKHPSILRQAMRKFFCYTTAFQAIELFSLARTEAEAQAVQDSMAAIKLLGLNPKSAGAYGRLLATHGRRDRWTLLIAGLCLESRLPILTARRREFAGIAGLIVVPPRMIEKGGSGEEILRALGHSNR